MPILRSVIAGTENQIRQEVILTHGFNVRDEGVKTTDQLRPYFEQAGYYVYEADYNWTGLLGVRLCNAKLARMMAGMVAENTIFVGHSNGCAIGWMASLCGAPFEQMILINPALDNDVKFGPQVKRIHVWHTRFDKPTMISKFLLVHPWGDLGRVGYKGNDPRVFNYNMADDFPMAVRGHSEVFKSPLKELFGPMIVEKAYFTTFPEQKT
jgi:pimeloyl-ACP methyl ester carboxylesterase